MSVEQGRHDNSDQAGQQIDKNRHHELLEIALFIGQLKDGQLEGDGSVVRQRIEAGTGNRSDSVDRTQIDGRIAYDRRTKGIHEQRHTTGSIGAQAGQQVDSHEGKQIRRQIHAHDMFNDPAENGGLLNHGTVADNNRDEHYGDQRAFNAAHTGLEGVRQIFAANQQEQQDNGQNLRIGGGLNRRNAER